MYLVQSVKSMRFVWIFHCILNTFTCYYCVFILFLFFSVVSTCAKTCIYGDCIRKYGHEVCLCQPGYHPSQFEKEWGFKTCFPDNNTCLVENNDLCSKHAHCDVTMPKSKCVCDEGYGFNREPAKNCRRKFSRECVRKYFPIFTLYFHMFFSDLKI